MTDRQQHYSYPGYDVLAKRDTPSWNEQTRTVVDQRLKTPDAPRFFDEGEWRTLVALCARILPQPAGRGRPVSLPGLIDAKMRENRGDGFRMARMPEMQEAWRQGLRAIEAEARQARDASFHALPPEQQDALIGAVQRGEVRAAEWEGLPAEAFFKQRVLHDIVGAYYSHPTAWSEIGFGGPASPRGYVRMGANQSDPWEAKETQHG